MNTSQIIVRCRDELDDNGTVKKFPDLEILRHIDEQQRVMIRTMIRSNPQWSNFSLALQKEDAKQIWLNTFEWRLPTWVEAIVHAYHRQDSDGSGETTFSPYRWTVTNPLKLGEQIQKSDSGRRMGWSWEGQHVLRLWNWNTAPEIVIEVVVSPPPMFKIAVATIPVAPVADKAFLPLTFAAADLGDLAYTEEGRYINSEVQVTGTTGANDLKLGQVRRVVYSSAATLDAATRRHELTFESAFASNVAVGDTLESIIFVPAMHSRLLVLRVVNACAIKKFNIDLQRSIADEMGSEMTAFAQLALGPRDSKGPFFKTSGVSSRLRAYDQNKLWGVLQ